MADQRANTRLLTGDEQEQVRLWFELPPITASSGDTRLPWDARLAGGQWDDQKKEELRTELTTAMTNGFSETYKNVFWKAKASHIPMEQVVPIARAAKRIVDTLYAEWLGNAVLTLDQMRERSQRTFTHQGAGANVIEVSDEAARGKDTWEKRIYEAVKTFVAFSASCQKVMKTHHFYPYGDRKEEALFLTKLFWEYAEANQNMIDVFDRYGSAYSDPASGKIFVSGAVRDWDGKDTRLAKVRDRKWELFGKIVHEYLHLLEHPLVPDATANNPRVREGFCEHLTIQTIAHVKGFADATLKDLAAEVEGDMNHPDAGRWNHFLNTYAPNPDYAAAVGHVKEFAAKHDENAVRAVFFQGHTEFLGRQATGWLPAAPSPAKGMQAIPVGRAFDTPAKLADVTRHDKKEIMSEYPVWVDEKTAPAHVVVQGFRGHRVASIGGIAETWQQIAAQHEVDPGDLSKRHGMADPPKDDWVLIPRSQ
ncbi:hypothetical protein ACGFNU_00855 [Spirillospora sp. NPDC048911]|uniref:hypothetical protein n=1 Tax=Spirillospora sp. NPDC048911 TaxID=3364527 RepID=UPI0037113FC7